MTCWPTAGGIWCESPYDSMIKDFEGSIKTSRRAKTQALIDRNRELTEQIAALRVEVARLKGESR